MYVTCLYDIYNKPEKMADYIKLFTPLVQSGLNIHLYTSSDLAHHFKNYPNNIKYYFQNNAGVGVARNTCIKNMSLDSDYTILLDSDDELTSDCIYTCLQKW